MSPADPDLCLFDAEDVEDLTPRQRAEFTINFLNRRGLKALPTATVAAFAGVSQRTIQDLYCVSLAVSRCKAKAALTETETN